MSHAIRGTWSSLVDARPSTPLEPLNNHHLLLLILCGKLVILAAGKKPKNTAPILVSIVFTTDCGDFKVQIACSLSDCPELETPVDGWGLSAVTDCPEVNAVMGTTILPGETDSWKRSSRKFRRLIRLVRYDFVESEGTYGLPGKDVARKVWMFSTQTVPIPEPFSSCETRFESERLMILPSSSLFARTTTALQKQSCSEIMIWGAEYVG